MQVETKKLSDIYLKSEKIDRIDFEPVNQKLEKSADKEKISKLNLVKKIEILMKVCRLDLV